MADWINITLSASGIVGTVGVYLWGKRSGRKALTYTHTSTKFVTSTHGGISVLKIHFEGREVSDVSLVNIEVRNSGGAPIEAKDFD